MRTFPLFTFLLPLLLIATALADIQVDEREATRREVSFLKKLEHFRPDDDRKKVPDQIATLLSKDSVKREDEYRQYLLTQKSTVAIHNAVREARLLKDYDPVTSLISYLNTYQSKLFTNQAVQETVEEARAQVQLEDDQLRKALSDYDDDWEMDEVMESLFNNDKHIGVYDEKEGRRRFEIREAIQVARLNIGARPEEGSNDDERMVYELNKSKIFAYEDLTRVVKVARLAITFANAVRYQKNFAFRQLLDDHGMLKEHIRKLIKLAVDHSNLIALQILLDHRVSRRDLELAFLVAVASRIRSRASTEWQTDVSIGERNWEILVFLVQNGRLDGSAMEKVREIVQNGRLDGSAMQQAKENATKLLDELETLEKLKTEQLEKGQSQREQLKKGQSQREQLMVGQLRRNPTYKDRIIEKCTDIGCDPAGPSLLLGRLKKRYGNNLIVMMH